MARKTRRRSKKVSGGLLLYIILVELLTDGFFVLLGMWLKGG